jgi:hypothetical protein
LYISATQTDAARYGWQISVTHSRDGGQTWTTVPVDTEQIPITVEEDSDLAIGADGTVYVTWVRCQETFAGCAGTRVSLYFAKSTDGGDTWSQPSVMTTVNLTDDSCECNFWGSLPNTIVPVENIPVVAVDNSSGPYAGSLYVSAYHWTGTEMRLLLLRSRDGGVTWRRSSPAPISDSNDHFFPWMNVNSKGVVGVTWLEGTSDLNTQYQAFVAISRDGGRRFFPPRLLSTVPSSLDYNGFNGHNLGDHTGNTWVGNLLYGAWPDTRTGASFQNEVGWYS